MYLALVQKKAMQKNDQCWWYKYLPMSIPLSFLTKLLGSFAGWEYWSAWFGGLSDHLCWKSKYVGYFVFGILKTAWIMVDIKLYNWQVYLLHLVSFNCSVLYKDKFTQQ